MSFVHFQIIHIYNVPDSHEICHYSNQKAAGTHCELKQPKSLYFKIIALPPYVPYEIQINYRGDLSNI